MKEPVYSAITVVMTAVEKVMGHEKLIVVAEMTVGVALIQISPLLALQAPPSRLGAGEALTVAVKVTDSPTTDGSGVSPTMLIAVATPV